VAQKDSSNSEQPSHLISSAHYLGLSTETIDINSALYQQLTESGSFDLRGFQLSSVGRLLNALPTPVLLIDSLFSIIFANESSRKLGEETCKIQSTPFCTLFARPADAAKFQGILEKLFSTRKLQVGEGLVEVGTNRLWCRMSFRSLRVAQARFVLLLIEDLTLEKKQQLLAETHKEAMRRARDKFEKQLQESTSELERMNERLRQEVEERTKAQQALEIGQESFSSIVEKTLDGIAVLDCQGAILYCNPTAARFLGSTPQSLIGECLSVSPTPGRITEMAIFRQRGDVGTAEMRVGRTQWKGKAAYLAILSDITERKRTEQELLRAQKLESLELIAGGLAHDFNNLLTANVANISLAKIRAEAGSPVRDALTKAEKAASKARELTRQLLTFAKGRASVKKVTSLMPLLEECVALALSGSNVKCQQNFADDLWPTEIEPSQISMVFQNILINAQQAMHDGGTIIVKAENVLVGAESGIEGVSGTKPRYVRVTVSDRGSGISAENLSKIFDPYFTTKSKGTGLGLATSYAVIKKHFGRIEVESRVGKGTTFHVYLPASDQRIAIPETLDRSPIRGEGRILLMDDQEDIREVASNLMTLLGYQVETAENGSQAIEKYRAAITSQRPFAVVIMDLTIPGGMGGEEALKGLLAVDPRAKVIISSGHTSKPIMSNYKDHGFAGAIAKPYNAAELGEALRKAITGETNSQD
jgi:signal transduction histidine kinase/ActR/RegA family two-component response regulator